MGAAGTSQEDTVMLKLYVMASDLRARLLSDRRGVVSFEYVIVAACIVGAVGAAFGTGATGAIGTALVAAIGKITTALGTAVP
jgi:Flp pilus assembly pilin Flp